MSFTFLNNFFILFSLTFVISCQSTLFSSDKNDNNNKTNNNKYIIETNEKLDILSTKIAEEEGIDFYSNKKVDYNFLDKKYKRIKLDNYEGKYFNNLPINVIYNKSKIFSINSKGNILIFNQENGKLEEELDNIFETKNNEPVSFTLVDQDFIIGFKSGEIFRTTTEGEIIWSYKKNDLLNTPIKLLNDKLIILYSDNIVILSVDKGDLIYEKYIDSNNIIQSSGGKINNYFNLVFYVLPNSEFNILDTFLYSEHVTKLKNINKITPLNNLDDYLHVYENYFVYLDNGNNIYTYDILKDEFLLYNYQINSLDTPLLFNNSLILKNEKTLDFINLKNGNLFVSIDIFKKLKKDSKIIYIKNINKKLHLFSNKGDLIILNSEFKIEYIKDLKIKNINKIYSYQNKLFVSTKNGITYIY